MATLRENLRQKLQLVGRWMFEMIPFSQLPTTRISTKVPDTEEVARAIEVLRKHYLSLWHAKNATTGELEVHVAPGYDTWFCSHCGDNISPNQGCCGLNRGDIDELRRKASQYDYGMEALKNDQKRVARISELEVELAHTKEFLMRANEYASIVERMYGRKMASGKTLAEELAQLRKQLESEVAYPKARA